MSRKPKQFTIGESGVVGEGATTADARQDFVQQIAYVFNAPTFAPVYVEHMGYAYLGWFTPRGWNSGIVKKDGVVRDVRRMGFTMHTSEATREDVERHARFVLAQSVWTHESDDGACLSVVVDDGDRRTLIDYYRWQREYRRLEPIYGDQRTRLILGGMETEPEETRTVSSVA